MRKIHAYLGLILAMVAVSFLAQAQSQEPNDSEGDVRYISDDLYTFLHSGPGRNYRILGSVQAGTRVMQLQVDPDTNFVEVIDDKQRTGWVDSTFITTEQSIRERLPELQQRLKLANDSLNAQQAKTDSLNQQISDLTESNELLQQQLQEVQQQNASYKHEIDTQDNTEQMEWFTRGGLVALGGLILGVIIAYLPKKRRRGDQWM